MSDKSSVISTYSDHYGHKVKPGAPSSFSGVVGMDTFRAKRIIEAWGYYVIFKDFPAIKKKELLSSDPTRVIVYLDKDGYVGTTPKVG